jgi:UDP-2-acetamido-3-amino-2,3-dideoxy-glucuronate N-acetyltransferase
MIHPSARIHDRAQVDGSVSIGAWTKVWQFATVILGTEVGEETVIGASATLSGPRIGSRCKISSGVVMGPGFWIGDEVFMGPNVVLANDMWPEVSAEGYDDKTLRLGRRHCVVIEDGASIGANAVILPGVRVGQLAMVAAGAVVDRNVPDGCLWHRSGRVSQVPASRREKRMRYASQ